MGSKTYTALDLARQADANASIERFNGLFRCVLLNHHLFRSLTHVCQLVDEWMHNNDIFTRDPTRLTLQLYS